MSAHGGGRDVARKLSEHGIVTNKNLLPGDPGNSVVNPGGIRTGVQEMTRFGMGEAEMDRIAELIHECVVGGKDVTAECKQLRETFPEVKFGYGVGQLSEITARHLVTSLPAKKRRRGARRGHFVSMAPPSRAESLKTRIWRGSGGVLRRAVRRRMERMQARERPDRRGGP